MYLINSYKPVQSDSLKKRIALFSGASNTLLANEIAAFLGTRVSRSMSSASDEEHFVFFAIKVKGGVRILDPVSNKNVYIIQSLSPPINDNLMELLLLISAARRSACKKVTAIIPYMAYSKDIRPENPNYSVPYPGRMIARLVFSH